MGTSSSRTLDWVRPLDGCLGKGGHGGPGCAMGAQVCCVTSWGGWGYKDWGPLLLLEKAADDACGRVESQCCCPVSVSLGAGTRLMGTGMAGRKKGGNSNISAGYSMTCHVHHPSQHRVCTRITNCARSRCVLQAGGEVPRPGGIALLRGTGGSAQGGERP